jgi:hypothetical protein
MLTWNGQNLTSVMANCNVSANDKTWGKIRYTRRQFAIHIELMEIRTFAKRSLKGNENFAERDGPES